MLKTVYAANVIYVQCQRTAKYIYIVPIYMHARLVLGVYIYIYNSLMDCIQFAAYICIHIYNICSYRAMKRLLVTVYLTITRV